MKKGIKTILNLLIVLLLIPSFVMAEKMESKISATNGIIEKFEMDRIRVNNVGYTRFFNLNEKGPGVEVRGTVNNDYVKDIEVALDLVVYDKDKNVIATIPQDIIFPAKETTLYRAFVYESEIGRSLSDIKYFSLQGDFITNVRLVVSGENDEYYLENLNIKVNVNRNNVYNVEETFDATFSKYADSITVGIPFRHQYIDNGLKTNNRAIISDIETEGYRSLKTVKGYREITLGQEDRDTSTRSYNLKYNYNVGKDKNKGNDVFVFYLVDNNASKIKNLSFEITFPTEINKEDVSFIDSHGNVWEKGTYEVNGNVITGSINDVIESNSSYAVRVILKAGYFRGASNNISGLTILSILLPILFMSLTLFIWFCLNKLNEKKTYNAFYFNSDINSLEMSYLHNGEIKDTDIASLVFVLANKGYINVHKEKNGYKLVKVKDYDGHDRLEKSFMKELFYDKDKIARKDFKYTLTETKEVLLERINEIRDKKKLFMHNVLNYKLSFWAMIILIFIINTFDILLEYQPSVIPVNIIIGGLGYILLFGGYLSKDKPLEKTLYFLVALIFIIVPIVLTSYLAFVQDTLKLSAYIVGLLCMIVIALVMNAMGNRTVYGNMMYNKINAYKQFLINVDESKIITEEKYNNANLLYDVLPYAIVLGIYDKWMKKFKDSNIDAPDWYKCNNFKLDVFYQDVKNIYSDIFIALKSK